eukprot:631756-Pelagomonas_calceolata.AAC.10
MERIHDALALGIRVTNSPAPKTLFCQLSPPLMMYGVLEALILPLVEGDIQRLNPRYPLFLNVCMSYIAAYGDREASWLDPQSTIHPTWPPTSKLPVAQYLSEVHTQQLTTCSRAALQQCSAPARIAAQGRMPQRPASQNSIKCQVCVKALQGDYKRIAQKRPAARYPGHQADATEACVTVSYQCAVPRVTLKKACVPGS